MYSVYARNGDQTVCIYNDLYISDERKAQSPKLTLTESNAGDFSIKIPRTNVGYDFIERITTEITVKRQNKVIWSGRVISIKEDFYKNRTYTCEGDLAYLNDTTQAQVLYEDTYTDTLFQILINEHNNRVEDSKKFRIGSIGIHESIEETYTNYDSTLKALNSLLVEPFGGYLQVRRDGDNKTLDYIREEDRPTSNQEIRFGRNLLDFTKSFDSTDFCTVILPLGDRLQDKYGISMSGIDGVEAYVTVEDAEGQDGSLYVYDKDIVDTFGWIERVVNFNDIDDPDDLLDAAKEYLKSIQFDTMVLEANAVDLGYLNVDVSNISLSEQVRVISKIHGLDRFFPVKKISIPLDNPANTTFTMGSDVTLSLSKKENKDTNGIKDIIKNIPVESEILNNAKRNAADLIDSFTTGYITITTDDTGSNELFVTDTKITTKDEALSQANRYWRWNLNGLGYYNKNDSRYDNPSGLKLALTMDGAIVADFITAGTLTANVVRAGLLKSNYGNSYWNLDTGELYLESTTKFGDGNTVGDITRRISTTETGLSSEINARISADNGLVNDYTSRITQNYNSITTYVSQNYTTKTETGNVERSLYASIEQTASGILSTVSDTYETKDAANTMKSTLESSISQSAGEILTKVSNTYETKTEAESMQSSLESSILQTANSVVSMVSATGSRYDTTGYTISIYGINHPTVYGYYPENYRYKYYLNQSTGELYYSNGSSWRLIKTLPTVQSKLQTQITQNADSIKTKVSSEDVNGIVESSIEQYADLIRLKADKIVVQSDRFTVDEDGNMTCSNAKMNGDLICETDYSRGTNYYIQISNGEIYGGEGRDYYRDEKGKIDFHGTVEGRYGIHMNADTVAFSVSGLGVTEGRGDRTVHFGVTIDNHDEWNNQMMKITNGLVTKWSGFPASVTLTDSAGQKWHFDQGLLTNVGWY